MAVIERLREKLQSSECDALMISSAVNRRYVTGFTGSAGIVWLTADRMALVVDFRYTEQAAEQAHDWEIITHDGLEEQLQELVSQNNIGRLAIEGDHVSVQQWQKWSEKLAAELVPVTRWVEELRLTKTAAELEAIERAASIADHSFAQILPQIQPGAREEDIALELEFAMRKNGASGVSFAPIVASGDRGALPHARPGQRMLRHGDFVVMDFGCIYRGYCSDMTRTIVVGEPTEKHLVIYDLVLKAQETGLDAVRPGVTGVEADRAARMIIEESGYGTYFGHGLGHGVGLEVHEEPRLSRFGEHTLEEGMVVTVEPGVYLPGWGGVRIEDLVVVTEDGARCLSSTFKELYVVE